MGEGRPCGKEEMTNDEMNDSWGSWDTMVELCKNGVLATVSSRWYLAILAKDAECKRLQHIAHEYGLIESRVLGRYPNAPGVLSSISEMDKELKNLRLKIDSATGDPFFNQILKSERDSALKENKRLLEAMEGIKKLINEQRDMPPEFMKVVNEKFWSLLA